MAQIGTFTVTGFRGRMRKATQRVAVLDPNPGVDGQAVVISGWTNTPTTIGTAVDVTSQALAASLIEQYRAKHSEIVNVTDQFGIVWPNVTIINVIADFFQTPVATTWRVEATWILLPEATSA